MSLAVLFQIVISVVGPAGRPVLSDVAESLGQFSGHILHLVPGDYQYEPPQFTIVIGWNCVEHFFCTELASQDEVYEWKLALCHQFLNGAVDMFNETESQMLEEEDTVLVKAMQDLRDQMEVTSQILHNRVKSRDVTVPPVTVHSTRKTAMTKELKVDYVPVPLLRHQVREQNPADIPAKHAGGKAPSKIFPPILLGPALLEKEFSVPSNIQKPSKPSKRPAPEEEKEEEEETVTSKKPRRSTRSSSKAGSQVSLPVSFALPPPSQPVPSTAVVPGKPAKKFVCTQCGYTTDRKHDFDNHMNQHQGVKFVCSDCKKVFYSEGSRKQHIQTTHLKIKRARCPYVDCNFEDKDFGKLIVHKYDVHGEGKSSKCQNCGRKFENWRSFTRHQGTCGREKDKTCPVPQCRKQYKDLDKLTKHMQTAHSGTSYSPSICDKCGKVFKNDESLRTHQSTSCT